MTVNLSVPTKIVVSDTRGGASVALAVVSINIDEARGNLAQATVHTTTSPPAWYTALDFPVNAITIDIDSMRCFTGYVVKWDCVKPPNDWVIEAQDVLYIAENEWIVPDTIEKMPSFSGLITDFIYFLLVTTCGYTADSVDIGAIPYILGPQEPLEYGLESVLQLIERLNGILQTAIYADQNGVKHWGWFPEFPQDDFDEVCPSVVGATEGGVFFYDRSRWAVWAAIGASCGAYLAAMNSKYDEYNAAYLVLAEHRQGNLPGETATRPTRGNLVSWQQSQDEDTYRVGAVVFGLPPIRAEVDKGDFPYTPLATLNNVAILSSSIIQSQWVAEEVAQNLADQAIVKNLLRWEADGNPRFHINVDHFVDTEEFFGFGRVLSVTHSVDDSGYRIQGESRIGIGQGQGPPKQAIVQYTERILSADPGSDVSRYEGLWEMPVTFNPDTRKWENDQDAFDYSYSWASIGYPSWTSDVEVAWVPSPVTVTRVGTTEGYVTLEGYALAIGNGGIWRNYYVSDWTLTTAEIAAQWTRIMTTDQWLQAVLAEWTFYPEGGYGYGAVQTVQYWDDLWPGAGTDPTFTPRICHWGLQEPDFTLEPGAIRFAVMAGGMHYGYPQGQLSFGVPPSGGGERWYLTPGGYGNWYETNHVFIFRCQLGGGGGVSGLVCEGSLHADLGHANPYNGFNTFSAYSNASFGSDGLIVAQPRGYSFGAAVYSVGDTATVVDDELVRHGSWWFDSDMRYNKMVSARYGLCVYAGNSVRSYIAKKCTGVGDGGGTMDINLPSLGGGTLLDWRGISMWGGLEYGNLIALSGVTDDTEFGRWVENWDDGGAAPFIVNWWEPWGYLIYLITTDGKVYRQDHWFETPRDPGDYTTPEWELWERILDELGDTVLDGTWNLLLDWGGGVYDTDVPYLANPYTGAFYARARRLLPSCAFCIAHEIGTWGPNTYNFAPCGKGRKKVILLYDDGTRSDELDDQPPCCLKSGDPQSAGDRALLGDDGSDITGLDSLRGLRLRF